MAKTIYIGCSGYSYPSWKGDFYPADVPASRQLEYYSSVFNTVELNYTFYRFPTAKALEKAAKKVPDDFRFSVKMNRIVTHTLRMKDASDKIAEFNDIIVNSLGEKLACTLFQLPPSYSFSEERLEDVLKNIPPHPHNVVEFRHISWWDKKVIAALKKNHLTFCSVSFPKLPEENVHSGKVFYKRMHGVPDLFQSSYSQEQLAALANDIPVATEAFIYFNNTTFDAAYNNAKTLKKLLA